MRADLNNLNSRGTIRVLVVEDNPGDVRLMREALRSYQKPPDLMVVEDGDQAIRFLKRSEPFHSAMRPHLIFLDLNLPKRDGREVLREIKLDQELRPIPVIVFTTSDADNDIQRAYELSANCYVKKPSDLDEYLAVIKACENFWLNVVQLPS